LKFCSTLTYLALNLFSLRLPTIVIKFCIFLNLPEHNALQDGGERGDPDAGCNQDSMLSPEEVTGWSPVGSVDEDLKIFFVNCRNVKLPVILNFFFRIC
jgi:hypothetical protein